MLHRLLHLCLAIIATILLAGEALACPHHAEATQQVSNRLSDAASQREGGATATAGDRIDSSAAETVTVPDARPARAATPNPAERARTASHHASDVASPHGHHGCCGFFGCSHAKACVGGCCAAAQVFVGAGGRPEERRLAYAPPQRPAISIVAFVKRPMPPDLDRDRRRWREAEAQRAALREPRLAQVVRLTI
ncbi:MAG: hypothetical protein R3D44_00900 [Hyphomicrobiaceae bacterium]